VAVDRGHGGATTRRPSPIRELDDDGLERMVLKHTHTQALVNWSTTCMHITRPHRYANQLLLTFGSQAGRKGRAGVGRGGTTAANRLKSSSSSS